MLLIRRTGVFPFMGRVVVNQSRTFSTCGSGSRMSINAAQSLKEDSRASLALGLTIGQVDVIGHGNHFRSAAFVSCFEIWVHASMPRGNISKRKSRPATVGIISRKDV
jgi:hypothetical protein